MFIAALLITVKTQKQPRWPSMSEWINKLWYIYISEYDSALERNEPLRHTRTWRKLKCLLLTETRQFEHAKYCMIPIV